MQGDVVLADLRQAFERGEEFLVVHYACESFTDVMDRPLEVGCLAVVDVQRSTETVFAQQDAPPEIAGADREIDMFDRFFAFMRARPDARIVHWNMNGGMFGFNPLATRYRYLTQRDGYRPSAERMVDLDDLIENLYGEDYARHPKLASLATLNGVSRRQVLTGLEEATRFSSGDLGAVTGSAAGKARTIADLLSRLLDGTLSTQKSVGTVLFATGRIDAVDAVLCLGERFKTVSRSLARRHDNRPTVTLSDEYDAQDLMGSLLRIFFTDVRPEAVTPQYAAGSARVDFVLPEYQLAIELKWMRSSLSEKAVADQLIVDRDRYAADTRIKHLICQVFDYDGLLVNPRGLEVDLSRDSSQEGLSVTVQILE